MICRAELSSLRFGSEHSACTGYLFDLLAAWGMHSALETEPKGEKQTDSRQSISIYPREPGGTLPKARSRRVM